MTPTPDPIKTIEDTLLRQQILEKIHLAVRTEFFNKYQKNMQFLADDIMEVIADVRRQEWNKIHTKYEVGDIVGDYKITDRFRKIGKNTKYRVVCVLCGRPMFRYSNKFKLPHRDCPAYYKKSQLEQSQTEGGE